ncbi:PDZ domain-containing protein [Thalassotalea euphylliae]|nr:PDZ domain-containing protein [Thalassotalea euphylliae]
MRHIKLIITLILLPIVHTSFASERIKMGVTWSYSASGFFDPKVNELVAKEIVANSPADKAGLKVGDKVKSIEGCQIPGCPATKAKSYLTSKSLNQLKLMVETQQGTAKTVIVSLALHST